MYTMVFGFLWGMTTAYLGVGWFDGNLINALISSTLDHSERTTTIK